MTAADGGGEQFEDGGFALLPRHTKVRATPYRGEPEGDHRSEDASVSSSSRAERAGLFLSLSVPRVSSRARATRVATPHPRGPSASIASYRKTTRRAAPRIRPRPPRGRPPSNLPRDGSTRTTRGARQNLRRLGGFEKPSSPVVQIINHLTPTRPDPPPSTPGPRDGKQSHEEFPHRAHGRGQEIRRARGMALAGASTRLSPRSVGERLSPF